MDDVDDRMSLHCEATNTVEALYRQNGG
jgi:hypothetical protein